MTFPNQEMHRVATTAIIFRPDGRVLILRRAPHKKVWPNKWTVPGGGLVTDDYTNRPPTHIGETNQWYNTLERSVRREVYEETMLYIDTPWMVCDLTFIRPDDVPVLVLSFAANLVMPVSGHYSHVTMDSDSVEHAWVNLEESKNYDLIDGIHHELELAFTEWNKRKQTHDWEME